MKKVVVFIISLLLININGFAAQNHKARAALLAGDLASYDFDIERKLKELSEADEDRTLEILEEVSKKFDEMGSEEDQIRLLKTVLDTLYEHINTLSAQIEDSSYQENLNISLGVYGVGMIAIFSAPFI